MACISLFVSCKTYKTMISGNGQPDIIPGQMANQNTPHIGKPSGNWNHNVFSSQRTFSFEELEFLLGFPIQSDDNLTFLTEAATWIGVPYKHARNDKNGTDCSGLSCAIFMKLFGIQLDRTCDGQYFKNCKHVSRNKIKQGDFVFFKIGGSKISHVGIYLKNDKFIHASSSKGVVVSDLNDDYYHKYFFAAGRVPDLRF